MNKAAIAVVLALASVGAHADGITDYVHMELGAGVSHYQTAGDGQWYQQGMQHSLDLSAPVLMVGATGPIYAAESWGIDWHVDYVSLGHVSSKCECTPNDENYNAQTHTIRTPLPYDVPNANFIGNGNAQGIALTLEPYIKYRGFRFGVSGGLFPYRPSWNETITNWQPWSGVPVGTTTAATPHGIQIGKVVGVTLQRGNFGIAYQHYILPTRYDDAHAPAIWKGADVLMLTYHY